MRILPFSLLMLIVFANMMPATAQDASRLPGDFAAFVDQLAPAVVTVSRTGQGRQEAAEQARGTASGFIVDPSGLVATHAMVAADAQEVQVTLGDGTSFPAAVVGVDEQTGLALLRATERRRLPTLRFGSSEALAVGEWVVALGRPQAETPTVSVGVVAAPPNDLIKAEVTLGNDNIGGPVLNRAGRVVGFSTVMPGSDGVQQSAIIASERIRPVLQEIVSRAAEAERKPARLGVTVQAIDEALSRAFGIEPGTGIVVAHVAQGSPAAQAGIEPGDVITKARDKPVSSPKELRRLIDKAAAGAEIPITIRRGGEEKVVSVRLGTAEAASEPEQPTDKQAAEAPERPRLGIRIATLDPQIARQLDLREIEKGVVVVGVQRGSLAEKSGIEPGDVIVSLGGEPVDSAEGFLKKLEAKAAEEGPTVLRVVRDGSHRYVAVEL